MQFKVTSSRYRPDKRRLEFTASGNRNGCVFTVVTEVTCLKEPKTPENVHLVALARLTELFRQRSASGR
ncbi:hypothetical protein SAMN05428969_2746 [Devosia sp. YR412]|uniref:hypothetical protein n=1 Tax=Devosia sp. YR412 TaxID=1881030 RepID=UPI0008C7AC36|nr:hypothetical protein [Devosia sp. YR412]SEQ32722.1 hypothetical protein SAMN05428969_2746 [Devosia sp. YR412]